MDSKWTRDAALRIPIDDDVYKDLSPEQALYAAVLRNAIRDWLNYRRSSRVKKKKMAEEARQWLFSECEDNNSFNTICNFIDIDPITVRSRIKQIALIGMRTEEVENESSGRHSGQSRKSSKPRPELQPSRV